MARTPLTRNQWRALNRIRATSRERPLFPHEPRPWDFHKNTWSSLSRLGLVTFRFRRGLCTVKITETGHLALRHHEPRR